MSTKLLRDQLFCEMRFLATRVLGEEGRTISASQADYLARRPDNIPVFASHLAVCVLGELRELWNGDIDLSLWEQRLIVLSRLLDCELYLFYDGDHALTTQADAHARAISIFHPPGETLIPYGPASYISRDEDGILRLFT